MECRIALARNPHVLERTRATAAIRRFVCFAQAAPDVSPALRLLCFGGHRYCASRRALAAFVASNHEGRGALGSRRVGGSGIGCRIRVRQTGSNFFFTPASICSNDLPEWTRRDAATSSDWTDLDDFRGIRRR
jgi:hypothetical protein